jgi:hypothetical protein
MMSEHDKMFHLWFNTGFISDSYLCMHKEVLDRACKDKACKEFSPEFKCELFFEHVPAVTSTGGEEDEEAEMRTLMSSGAYLEADNDEDLDEEAHEVEDLDSL